MMKKIILITAIGFAFTACLKDKSAEIIVDECASDTVFFQDEIMAEIMTPSCSVIGCHDAGTAKAGFIFENYDQVSTGADAVFNAISHTSGTPMPIGADKLNDSLITKFNCWIKQGKLNN